MSLITQKNNRRGGGNKGGARRHQNNTLYAHPLPLVLDQPPPTWSTHILGLFGLAGTRVLNPHCEGVFDPATRSVWVLNAKDLAILWTRGFFGKGDLSRSEPSWRTRQISAKRAAAGHYMTAEEVREKRRAERTQFKRDRAAAMAQAAAEAEAAFAAGCEVQHTTVIPSGATWKPQQPLADAPPPAPAPEEDDDRAFEAEVPALEHLQLTLQEAFFLMWTLDCLTVLDPATSAPMSLRDVWTAFRSVQCAPQIPIPGTLELDLYAGRFDNPFLVHYAAYHYYRSLGWVIKGGIKFCVDLLLYKRGPVFHHAEFAVVVLPVYEDPADQESSPFDLANASPFSWTWLSTVNRVNSQVQKTLILTYVTIPARSRMSPDLLSSPACLTHYSVREVVLRRFIPARMRD
ncbi:hypothetical protein POSPLADRAFT_1137972 [Postia placenta MAD-698-R-SB12]|uniref:tRNA-splicing endonuclease subunit Sen2 n=1 Tax=Postia placenta MAD-698-R-SB12 TaxID=670580 RepID=A0A1X6N6I0_9APHY|nr:hypothetical protein POSPLADRAFT_1137972 [Postia placenta MAD-698-R-SB12]OSX64204.1 hypothetical protein POSPLADRAFT_1137972 [Postia placenta MAD-698-R-SB12]